MNSSVAKIVAVAALVGGVSLFAQYDRATREKPVEQNDDATDYVPVESRITKATQKCRLKKVSRSFMSTGTKTSGEIDCTVAVFWIQGHPEYQGAELISTTFVEVRYRSPADGQYHRKTMTFVSDRNTMSRYRARKPLKILAHVHEADRVRKFPQQAPPQRTSNKPPPPLFGDR